jgi:hypothetical protein
MKKLFQKKQASPSQQQPVEVKLPVNLTDENLDPYSETWGYVRKWCEKQLSEARERNDNPTLTEIRTALIRGRIETLLEILELPKPKKELKFSESQGEDWEDYE